MLQTHAQEETGHTYTKTHTNTSLSSAETHTHLIITQKKLSKVADKVYTHTHTHQKMQTYCGIDFPLHYQTVGTVFKGNKMSWSDLP